jgi:hypothetical protein
MATVPIKSDPKPETAAMSPVAECVVGTCGQLSVWLVRHGDRWLMYAGQRRAGSRRKDFASPFLGHAIRTAEAWYGPSAAGWRVEKGRNGEPNDSSAAAGV